MTAAPGETAGRPGDPLRGRHVVLGVCGSIACYKALEVASRLVQAGAQVDVALTAAAAQFVTPLAFRSLTAREPYLDMFRPHGSDGEAHVELVGLCLLREQPEQRSPPRAVRVVVRDGGAPRGAPRDRLTPTGAGDRVEQGREGSRR